MARRASRSRGERSGVLAAALGVVVAVLPVVYLGPGGVGGGPVGFAVLAMEVVAGAAGLGVVGAGVYSYRTGNSRPAVTAVALVSGLVVVGGIGAYVETTGGPLVPIPVWFLAGLLAVGAALGIVDRLTPGE